MNIVEMVEELFRNVPYSAPAQEAKKRITSALTREYDMLIEDRTPIRAMGKLLELYGALEDGAALAGYDAEAVNSWKMDEAALRKEDVKRAFRKTRYCVYLGCLCAALAISDIVGLVLYRNPSILLLLLLHGAIAWWALRKAEKSGKAYCYGKCVLTPDGMDYFKMMADRYRKRNLNGIVLCLSVIVYFAFTLYSAASGAHYKISELQEMIYGNGLIYQLPVYICLKNFFCSRYAERCFDEGSRRGYRMHLKAAAAISMGYWLLVLLLLWILQNHITYTVNYFMAALTLFLIMLLVYDLTLRRAVVTNSITLNKKRLAAFSLILCLTFSYHFLRMDSWVIQPYISRVSAVEHRDNQIQYHEDTGVYTITAEGKGFRILQLTDIHLGGSAFSASKDLKALKAVHRLIEYTKPDLVVVTGDMVFPVGVISFSLNNYTPVMQFGSFMRNIGVPWAFVYGNHDTESYASSSAEDLNELYQSMSYRSTQNLLYPYIQPDITGRNTQVIEIRNRDGSLNQALFLLDSNAYTGEGLNTYDYIHDDQVAWYEKQVKRLSEEEGHTISSLAFFHMPLQEYKEAYALYEKSSSKVQYHFGVIGETMIDKICCSDHPSSFFDRAEMLGSTKGMFCGHDHYNNLSVTYRGIQLTYGMSIDYLAMPDIAEDTAQRGGTLITLDKDSKFKVKQVKLTNIERAEKK